MNLFSVFDPTSYYGISFNWIVLIMVFIYMPSMYYLMSGFNLNLFKNLNFYLNRMFYEISYPNFSVLSYMSIIVFMYLAVSNLLGLFPFIFTSTAHPVVVMGLGLLMWMSFFLMGLIKNSINSAAHLVPEGSPFLLSPLMVLIESISHFIRPFTLSIRLAANMMAGHLIIGLLASVSMINLIGFLNSLIFQSILLLLEFGVAIIQGFVFSILMLLYALEYY